MTRVAVLHGGMSAEREVSLTSGAQVIAALRGAGYEVLPVEVTADLGALIAALTPAPDVVFNALHGRFGEDGTIQGVLDYLGIPYTHSGVRASALAMDKAAAKAVFAAAGLPVAPHRIIDVAELADHDPLPPPYVVKPVNEGSSVGVYIVKPEDNTPGADRAGMALRPGDGGALRAGPRADRGRAGGPRAGGDGNPADGKILRL